MSVSNVQNFDVEIDTSIALSPTQRLSLLNQGGPVATISSYWTPAHEAQLMRLFLAHTPLVPEVSALAIAYTGGLCYGEMPPHLREQLLRSVKALAPDLPVEVPLQGMRIQRISSLLLYRFFQENHPGQDEGQLKLVVQPSSATVLVALQQQQLRQGAIILHRGKKSTADFVIASHSPERKITSITWIQLHLQSTPTHIQQRITLQGINTLSLDAMIGQGMACRLLLADAQNKPPQQEEASSQSKGQPKPPAPSRRERFMSSKKPIN